VTSGPSRQVSELASEPCGSRVPLRSSGCGATRTPKGSHLYLFSGEAPDPAGSLPSCTSGSLGGVRTHGLVPTTDAPFSAELPGQVSRRHDSNARSPPSEGGALILLSYGEEASTAGVEPASSGFVDRRLDPFGHVEMTARTGGAPPTGVAP
jgi:hypothetical protein